MIFWETYGMKTYLRPHSIMNTEHTHTHKHCRLYNICASRGDWTQVFFWPIALDNSPDKETTHSLSTVQCNTYIMYFFP